MDQNKLTARHDTGLWGLLLRIGAVASLAALLWEFVTAGQLITYNMDFLPLHYGGAFAVHAATGLLALAALMVWLRSRNRTNGTRSPELTLLVVSLGAFVTGFPQAATGTYGPLQLHVPLALLLASLTVWAAVLAFRHRSAAG